MSPELNLMFRLSVEVGVPVEQGTFEGQRRRLVSILGGTVSGPRFEGRILPGGADWQTLRETDGNTRAFARYLIEHADGTVIEVTNPGIRRGPPEVMARLAAGERVDPDAYYFRTSPAFQAPPGPHDWLNQNTFVGVGQRWPRSV